MLNPSVFPNFGQGPFPKIAGKSPDSLHFKTKETNKGIFQHFRQKLYKNVEQSRKTIQ